MPVPKQSGPDTGISFSKQILPLVLTQCATAACHVRSNSDNFPLENYYDVINYGGIVPGNPAGSDFYDVIQRTYMPLGSDPLDSVSQKEIYLWILEGALEN